MAGRNKFFGTAQDDLLLAISKASAVSASEPAKTGKVNGLSTEDLVKKFGRMPWLKTKGYWSLPAIYNAIAELRKKGLIMSVAEVPIPFAQQTLSDAGIEMPDEEPNPNRDVFVATEKGQAFAQLSKWHARALASDDDKMKREVQAFATSLMNMNFVKEQACIAALLAG